MDRFQLPTLSDEYSLCEGVCERKLHYEELNADGFCSQCEQQTIKEETDDNKKES